MEDQIKYGIDRSRDFLKHIWKEALHQRGGSGKEAVFRLARDPATYEIKIISSVKLADYHKITHQADWELLKKFAQPLKGKTVVFINSTMVGGGVAMLRPPLTHLLNRLGINAHWYVLEDLPNVYLKNPFEFTKMMHNILQRRSSEHLTREGKEAHKLLCEQNFQVLKKQQPIVDADVIVLDDTQPAPLFRMLKQINPKAKWIWRDHMDTSHTLMSRPGTPQAEVASYILDELGIKQVNAFVTHPVDEFVLPGTENKTYFVPATIDLFDDLNRELTVPSIKEGISFINHQIFLKNFNLYLRDQVSRVSLRRPRIVLIARFDESKGMDIALRLGVAARNALKKAGVRGRALPQIIIAGNGSIDDPSGERIYKDMLRLRRNYPRDLNDIIIIRLKHNYGAVNALMNPLPRKNGEETCVIGLQTSLAEGLETRVSDWIHHGIPVVISNRGGMSLQVKEGMSGIILDYNQPDYDINRGAEFIASTMLDKDKYKAFRNSTKWQAQDYTTREFTTSANAIRWTRIFGRVLSGKHADRKWMLTGSSSTQHRLP